MKFNRKCKRFLASAKCQRHQQRRQAGNGAEGYSLVELLVVLAIIVLLGTIAVPQFLKYLDRAKQDTARAQIQSLSATLDLFKLDVGRYPGQEEGLDALIAGPADAPGWNGPYLKRKDMLLDPWHHAYRYKAPGEHGDYDLFSYGADDKEGGDGVNKDVTNW
jgi:general secretion pathway protein G